MVEQARPQCASAPEPAEPKMVVREVVVGGPPAPNTATSEGQPSSETPSATTAAPTTAAAAAAKAAAKAKKVYSKFQYRDTIFKVGDICRFFQEANVPDLVGKIM